MTFLRPWILLILPAVAAWAAWEWRKTHRHGALALKAVMLALVAIALGEPKLTVFERKVDLAVLADTSASVPSEDRKKESELVARLRTERGRHSLQVLPFAASTRALRPDEDLARAGAGPETRSTNLEAAIRSAIGRLPEGRVPRILLVSDGQENVGSVERAIYQARLLGIPVDTYALDGSPRPDLQLESTTLPAQAFTGERFQIEVVVSSPRAAPATLEITADGKLIGRAEMKLAEGRNTLRARAQLDAAGATPLSGLVASHMVSA